MVLHQNPISSMHLKMRLARRYTSPVLLYLRHPFLGASPDGVINDSEIVEVKKVELREGESLDDGMCRFEIYKKNGSELMINKNHKYYHQMQQRLFFAPGETLAILLFQVIRGVTQNLFLLTLYFGRVCFQNLSNSILIIYFLNLFIHEFFMDKQGGTRTCSFQSLHRSIS